MKVSLTYYRGDDFYRLLPPDLMDSRYSEGRVQVMAFPPTRIETLAPIISQRGHEVRMFDTFHPLMEKEHIAQAARTEKPDVIALSFFRRLPTPSPATWRVGLTDILGHACDNRWCFRDY